MSGTSLNPPSTVHSNEYLASPPPDSAARPSRPATRCQCWINKRSDEQALEKEVKADLRHVSERLRLETLIARDGSEQAKQWAKKTAGLYLSSLRESTHFASQSDWKALFENSIQELTHFVETGELR